MTILDDYTDTVTSAREFDREVLLAISKCAWEIENDYSRNISPADRGSFFSLAEACDQILHLQERS